MKGTFFQDSLEYRLVVEGESWHQGSLLSGTLQVRNHASSPASLSDLNVSLADGIEKKVKAKAEDAFSVLASVQPAASAKDLGAGQSSEPMTWEIPLDENAR